MNTIEKEDILLKHSNDLINDNKKSNTPKPNLKYQGYKLSSSKPLKFIIANLK